MTWQPFQKAHSIVRVRILIQFMEKIPSSTLSGITRPIVDGCKELGFDGINNHVYPLINTSNNPLNVLESVNYAIENTVTNRISNNQIVESIGIQDNVFAYMSFEYSRWKNFLERFKEIFEDPLKNALELVSLDRIKLEYWDKFYFNGDPMTADVSQLIENFDPIFPDSVTNGDVLWNSNVGWTEKISNFAASIQRNLQEFDEMNANNIRRSLNSTTVVELFANTAIKCDTIWDSLNCMHNRAGLIFGKSLKANIREQIGLNLEEYEQ